MGMYTKKCKVRNPCDTNNGECSANASCTNVSGRAKCKCNAGFTGDGQNCEKEDPCKTNNGGCSADASCTRVDEDKVKCSCKAGFTGDGKKCEKEAEEEKKEDEEEAGDLCTWTEEKSRRYT